MKYAPKSGESAFGKVVKEVMKELLLEEECMILPYI